MDTPLDIAGPAFRSGHQLLHAARSGSAQALARMIERGDDPMHRGEDGWTPLHWAVARGHRACAELLILAGADLADSGNPPGWTPVRGAVENDDVDMLRLLERAGAKLDSPELGLATIDAAGADAIECMGHLIGRGLDLDARDDRGLTPLMWAAFCGAGACLRALIGAGAALEARQARPPAERHRLDGAAALMHATSARKPEAMAALIAAGADVDGRRDDGATCSMAAAEAGDAACLALLIAAGADLDARAIDGRMAEDCALVDDPGCQECAAMILARKERSAIASEAGRPRRPARPQRGAL